MSGLERRVVALHGTFRKRDKKSSRNARHFLSYMVEF